MLFHVFNFSQNVCFWHITIYKRTNLKVSKRDIFSKKKKSVFKNYNERLVWTTKLIFKTLYLKVLVILLCFCQYYNFFLISNIF